MKLKDVGEIIAKRNLTVVNDKNLKRSIHVLMGKPRRLPDSQGDSFCPWQIIGISDEQVHYAAGIDSVQALQLAMRMIGAHLEFINKQIGGNLRWAGDKDGDLGFPLLVGGKWTDEP